LAGRSKNTDHPVFFGTLTVTPDAVAAFSLLNADAVRTRTHHLLQLGLADRLPNFRVDLPRLDAAADLVLEVTRKAYPTLEVPFHSRWRHFVRNGEDRWAALDRRTDWHDKAARARAAFDLAIVSVFLDAGAGPHWRYRERGGDAIGRSEGLAIASLDMFVAGAFSANACDPLRADALSVLSPDALNKGFQVSEHNPLVGVDGRAALLRRLGETVAANPAIFATQDAPRPGGLFDHFVALAEGGRVEAATILSELLRHLGPIWPSRLNLGGVALGDCWQHPAMQTADATNELVPLHKLSQWLAYSLIEPLQDYGITVAEIDGLTGLAEYRNGGLFVDGGILVLRDPKQQGHEHDVASPLVVEWRALTVALLDELAARLRDRLHVDARSLPLAKVLEGGTWATGRLLARERREDASPPIRVTSDGTVF
jgi:Protein of unknown function (DUF1688)